MPDTVKLWRVRHRNRDHGPFDEHNFAMRFNDLRRYPTPYAENLPLWRCAVRNLTQLRHWFGRKWAVADMERRGFVLVELEVPNSEVRFGERQVVFQPRDAKVTGAWPVSNILLPRHAWAPPVQL